MSRDGAVEIIEPPRHLGLKAVPGRGPSLQEILARCRRDIRELATHFELGLEADLEVLQKSVALLRGAGSEPGCETALEEIYARCHELRGLAGSFGYPLVSEIALSLCRFLEQSKGRTSACNEVIIAHVDAIRAVVHERVGADGGTLGRDLADGLRQLSQLALAHHGRV
jgi:hypothetical protein